MPFYIVEQKGVRGKRLVEADKPADALNHVVKNQFEVKRVDDRNLIDAWQEYSGAKHTNNPLPEEKSDDDDDEKEELDPDRLREDKQDLARAPIGDE